jgi:hypothetical protein
MKIETGSRSKLKISIPVVACVLATLGVGSISPAAAKQNAVEKRCGWLTNPSPGNSYFFDRDGRWILGEQGGYQLADEDEARLPATRRGSAIVDSRGYGYSCSCLNMQVDRKSRRAVRIVSGTALPLKQCRADRRLPKM